MAEPPLPPVPPAMNAEILHDGVRWVVSRTFESTFVIGSVIGPILLMAFAAAGVTVGVVGLAGLGLFAAAIAVRVPLRTEARLTDRLVVIEAIRLTGRSRTVFRLDELDFAKVSDPPELGGTGQVVLRAGETVLAFGRDTPREHAEWFVDAVEAAVQVVARRERREGREYGFLRVAPEEVDSLRGPTRD